MLGYIKVLEVVKIVTRRYLRSPSAARTLILITLILTSVWVLQPLLCSSQVTVVIYEYPIIPQVKPVAGFLTSDGSKAFIIGYTSDIYSNKTILVVQSHDLKGEAKVIRTLPIVGDVTAYNFDTLNSRYLVIGTSRGEVVVVDVKNGWFRYIEGVRSAVKSVYLANTKLIVHDALDYAYVFDIGRGGWCEIGLIVGNATLCRMEYKLVSYITPMMVLSGGKYAYDPSLAALIYRPPAVKVVIRNLTDATTGQPITDAVAIAYAVNTSLVYGTTIVNGTGYIDLLIGYVWYINITHPSYRTLTIGPFNITRRALGRVIELKNLVMYPGPGEFISPPPAGMFLIELLDLSGAPAVIRKVKAVGTLTSPPMHVNLIKPATPLGESSYVLLASTSAGELRLIYLNDALKVVKIANYTLAPNVYVTSSAASSDGGYIALGMSDGSIYVLKWGADLGYHYLLHAAKVSGSIVSVTFSDSAKAIIAFDSDNYMHLIKVTPTTIYPYLRFDKVLAYYVADAVYHDSLPDLSLVSLFKLNSIEVMMNFNTILSSSYVDLKQYKLPKVELKVIDSRNNEPIVNATVVLLHVDTGASYAGYTDSNGEVTFWNLMKGKYLLTVVSPIPQLNDYMKEINILEDRELTILLEPKIPLLKMNIVDARTLKLITEPLNIIINGTSLAFTVTNGTASIRLPYGNYTIMITPAPQYAYMYNATVMNISLTEDTEITIPLLSYNLTLTITDAESGGKPLVPLVVIVDNVIVFRNYTLPTCSLKLSPGLHRIHIEPEARYAYAYVPQEFNVEINDDRVQSIELRRRMYEVSLILSDPYGGIVAPLNMYINESLFLTNVTRNEITMSLFFGNHTIKIAPVAGFENAYDVSIINITLRNNVRKEIVLSRKIYNVGLVVKDSVLGVNPAVPVKVYVDGALVNETRSFPINLTLPYGTHRLRIEPTDPKVYEEYEGDITVSKDLEAEVTLKRKIYTLAVTVYNDIGEPAATAFVRAYSELGNYQDVTDVKGTVFLMVPYGTYTLEVSYPGYTKFVQAIDVSGNREIPIVLKPTLRTLILRFLPIIITSVSALAVVIVFLKLRAKIAEKILAAEEYF